MEKLRSFYCLWLRSARWYHTSFRRSSIALVGFWYAAKLAASPSVPEFGGSGISSASINALYQPFDCIKAVTRVLHVGKSSCFPENTRCFEVWASMIASTTVTQKNGGKLSIFKNWKMKNDVSIVLVKSDFLLQQLGQHNLLRETANFSRILA